MSTHDLECHDCHSDAPDCEKCRTGQSAMRQGEAVANARQALLARAEKAEAERGQLHGVLERLFYAVPEPDGVPFTFSHDRGRYLDAVGDAAALLKQMEAE